jgi:antitoxin CptB
MSDTLPAAAELDVPARRLLWRCRRGMKELDVLLERFARDHLAAADPEERAVFARFLELPDPLLAEYLLGDRPPEEPEFARLARSIAAAPAIVR